MAAGVYAITNTLSGKRYIGSAHNLRRREQQHWWRLNHSVHPNRHLQRAWDRDGGSVFTFSTLLICDVKNLLFYEQRALDLFGVTNKNKGYNKRIVAHSNAGLPCHENTRRAVAEMMRDPIRSAKVRAKASELGKLRAPFLREYLKDPQVKARQATAARAQVLARCKGVPLSAEQIIKYKKAVRLRNSNGIATNVSTPRKLTAKQVIEIRTNTQLSKRALSRKFGINRKTLKGVMCGRTYNWVLPTGTGPGRST